MPKMNPLIKAKWVSALRSGEFKQGTMQLRTLDDKYCCLGVLCALAVREGVIDPPLPGVQGQFTDAYYFDGNKNSSHAIAPTDGSATSLSKRPLQLRARRA